MDINIEVNNSSKNDFSEKQELWERSLLAERLQILFKERKATQKQLAQACGVSHQVISQYIKGITEPVASNLVKIAQFFDVSTDYLLGLTDYPGKASNIQEIEKELKIPQIIIECLASSEWGDTTRLLIDNNDFREIVRLMIFCEEVNQYLDKGKQPSVKNWVFSITMRMEKNYPTAMNDLEIRKTVRNMVVAECIDHIGAISGAKYGEKEE